MINLHVRSLRSKEDTRVMNLHQLAPFGAEISGTNTDKGLTSYLLCCLQRSWNTCWSVLCLFLFYDLFHGLDFWLPERGHLDAFSSHVAVNLVALLPSAYLKWLWQIYKVGITDLVTLQWLSPCSVEWKSEARKSSENDQKCDFRKIFVLPYITYNMFGLPRM